MTRPTRQSPDDIRRAIVDAAVRLVGERGIDGLTHRAVALAANVSLSSTTYYFASKAMIVSAALQHVVELDVERLTESTDRLHALMARGEKITAGALVDMLMREVVELPIDLRARYHLQLEAVEHPELQTALRSWAETNIRRTADILRELGSAQPDLDARLLVATADGLRLNAFTVPLSTSDGPALRSALTRMITAIADVEE